MTAKRGLVAFRTHLWDDQIAAMARRLHARCSGWDFTVLIDETRTTFDTAPYAKVSHTEDFSDLGLPRSGDRRELWYNCDYGYYRLLTAEPRYDYFCISEYDVFVNADLSQLFAAVVDEQLDFVTHRFGVAAADWRQGMTSREVYPVVCWTFNPFVVISRPALEYLLARRQALAHDWTAGRFPHWPYFEAFVGSELFGKAEFHASPLTRFVRLDHFDWWPPYLPDRAPQLGDQMLVHPVLDGQRFVRSRLFNDKQPARYFAPRSILRRDLSGLPLWLVAKELFATLLRRVKLRLRARPASK